jgi:hypothetical protein
MLPKFLAETRTTCQNFVLVCNERKALGCWLHDFRGLDARFVMLFVGIEKEEAGSAFVGACIDESKEEKISVGRRASSISVAPLVPSNEHAS